MAGSLEYQCTEWNILLEPARNLSEAFLVVPCSSGPFSTEASRNVVHHLIKSSLITKTTLWATSVKWQR